MVSWPKNRHDSFFAKSAKPTPTPSMGSAYLVIFMAIIHPVMVVPIFAPQITPIACCSSIRPALTNPTTITVVTELLWIVHVTKIPTATAIRRFAVNALTACLSLSPAIFCRESDMACIPYMNNPSPPIVLKIMVWSKKTLLTFRV